MRGPVVVDPFHPSLCPCAMCGRRGFRHSFVLFLLMPISNHHILLQVLQSRLSNRTTAPPFTHSPPLVISTFCHRNIVVIIIILSVQMYIIYALFSATERRSSPIKMEPFFLVIVLNRVISYPSYSYLWRSTLTSSDHSGRGINEKRKRERKRASEDVKKWKRRKAEPLYCLGWIIDGRRRRREPRGRRFIHIENPYPEKHLSNKCDRIEKKELKILARPKSSIDWRFSHAVTRYAHQHPWMVVLWNHWTSAWASFEICSLFFFMSLAHVWCLSTFLEPSSLETA